MDAIARRVENLRASGRIKEMMEISGLTAREMNDRRPFIVENDEQMVCTHFTPSDVCFIYRWFYSGRFRGSRL